MTRTTVDEWPIIDGKAVDPRDNWIVYTANSPGGTFENFLAMCKIWERDHPIGLFPIGPDPLAFIGAAANRGAP